MLSSWGRGSLHRLTVTVPVTSQRLGVFLDAPLPGTERALEIRVPVPVAHGGRVTAAPALRRPPEHRYHTLIFGKLMDDIALIMIIL